MIPGVSESSRVAIVPIVVALVALLAGALAPGAGGARGRHLVLAGPGHAGPVRLGDTVRSLHRRRLIRRLRPGCELDPGQRVARLRPPLKGFAIFFHGGRRLSALNLAGGVETARGIRVGSTARAARRAYPKARYDRPGTLEPFAQGFIWVNRIRRPKMTFVIDSRSHRVSAIALPSPSFCE